MHAADNSSTGVGKAGGVKMGDSQVLMREVGAYITSVLIELKICLARLQPSGLPSEQRSV